MAELIMKLFTKCEQCKTEIDLFDKDDCLILQPNHCPEKGDLHNLKIEVRDYLNCDNVYVEYECKKCMKINKVICFVDYY